MSSLQNFIHIFARSRARWYVAAEPLGDRFRVLAAHPPRHLRRSAQRQALAKQISSSTFAPSTSSSSTLCDERKEFSPRGLMKRCASLCSQVSYNQAESSFTCSGSSPKPHFWATAYRYASVSAFLFADSELFEVGALLAHNPGFVAARRSESLHTVFNLIAVEYRPPRPFSDRTPGSAFDGLAG